MPWPSWRRRHEADRIKTMSEPWDLDAAETLLRDAEAVVGELLPSLDETSASFSSESFEATVTGDNRRLLQLAEEVKEFALLCRHTSYLLEAFAMGVEMHSMPLCRVAAHELRRLAQREHRIAVSDWMTGGGVQGVG